MKVFLLSQHILRGGAYDSAVVAAESIDKARMIHPCKEDWGGGPTMNWVTANEVTVQYIGEAPGMKSGVILASYNP